MNWIKLSHSDMESALNKPQLDILKAAELASPGRDIVTDIIASVVARVRAEVSASQINMLDADHSRIPAELKECALSLALEALHSRLPLMNLGETAGKRADAARETLKRVANGELPISRPLCGIQSAKRKGISVCKSRKSIFNGKSMEGL